MTESCLSWTGWLKVGAEPWSRVAVAPTWGEAWDALLACADEAVPRDAPVACSLALDMIVNDGRHPEHRRKPR